MKRIFIIILSLSILSPSFAVTNEKTFVVGKSKKSLEPSKYLIDFEVFVRKTSQEEWNLFDKGSFCFYDGSNGDCYSSIGQAVAFEDKSVKTEYSYRVRFTPPDELWKLGTSFEQETRQKIGQDGEWKIILPQLKSASTIIDLDRWTEQEIHFAVDLQVRLVARIIRR